MNPQKETSNNGINVSIVLENPNLAANIGGIIRNAVFFGVHHIYVVDMHHDLWSKTGVPYRKTWSKIRSASSQAHKFIGVSRVASIDEIIGKSCDQGNFIVGTSPYPQANSVSLYEAYLPTTNVVLVFGNESQGMTSKALEACDVSWQIPRFSDFDSLNLAVSSGVILSHIRSGLLPIYS